MDRKATLLSRKDDHVNGGFEFTGYDVSDAVSIAKADAEFARAIAFLPATTPLAPASRFGFGTSENYFKQLVLEEFGVLTQVVSTGVSKFGQTYWTMTGVCPFHRRVHRNQHWILCEGKRGDPKGGYARCMKPLKRFTSTAHYPTKHVGDIELVSDIAKHKDRLY